MMKKREFEKLINKENKSEVDFFNLATSYIIGKYVEKDEQKAFEYYLKAADLNFAPAQEQVALRYDSGLGIPQNDVKAFDYFLKAAKNGSHHSQRAVSISYESGDIVKQNFIEAYAWLSIYRSQINEENHDRNITEEKYQELQSKLSPENELRAQKLAAEYWEKYVVPFQKTDQ